MFFVRFFNLFEFVEVSRDEFKRLFCFKPDLLYFRFDRYYCVYDGDELVMYYQGDDAMEIVI
jgi:hypothetical protein